MGALKLPDTSSTDLTYIAHLRQIIRGDIVLPGDRGYNKPVEFGTEWSLRDPQRSFIAPAPTMS